ncbi:unnamed protein product [Amoebophrya sp. A120]|nr:unnamed protein product [Amoebophrya sp. A120]|eukprot:GSA120T00012572001.1
MGEPGTPAGGPDPKKDLQLIVNGFSAHLTALNGKYFCTAGTINHARPLFKKAGQFQNSQASNIYYWDERDGPDLAGWWCAPVVGGEEVWAHNPEQSALPPATGWRVPWHRKEPDPKVKMEVGEAPVIHNPVAKAPTKRTDETGAPDAKRQKVDDQAKFRKFGMNITDAFPRLQWCKQNLLNRINPPQVVLNALNPSTAFNLRALLLQAETAIHNCENASFDGYPEEVVQQFKDNVETLRKEIMEIKDNYENGAQNGLKFVEETAVQHIDQFLNEVDIGIQEIKERDFAKVATTATNKGKSPRVKPQDKSQKTPRVDGNAHNHGLQIKPSCLQSKASARACVKHCNLILKKLSALDDTMFTKCRETLKKALDTVNLKNINEKLDHDDEKKNEEKKAAIEALKVKKPLIDELRQKVKEKYAEWQLTDKQIRFDVKAKANSVLVEEQIAEKKVEIEQERAERKKFLQSKDTEVLEVLFYIEKELLDLQSVPGRGAASLENETEDDSEVYEDNEKSKEDRYAHVMEVAEQLKSYLNSEDCLKSTHFVGKSGKSADQGEKEQLFQLSYRMMNKYSARLTAVQKKIQKWNLDRAQYEATKNLDLDVRLSMAIQTYITETLESDKPVGSKEQEQEFFDKMVGNDKVKHAHMRRKTIGHEEIFEFLASECIGDAEMWNRIPTLLNRCYELRDQELTEKKPGAKKTETGMEGQDEDTGPQKSEYARVNAGEVFCEDFFLYLGKVHLMCEIETLLTASSDNCNTAVPKDEKQSDEYIGKIQPNEVLTALEPPQMVKAGFKRIRVRRARDGVEGWVTMRGGPERTQYVTPLDPQFLLQKDSCPLYELPIPPELELPLPEDPAAAEAGAEAPAEGEEGAPAAAPAPPPPAPKPAAPKKLQVQRLLTRGERILVLSSDKTSKVMSLKDGMVGMIKDINVVRELVPDVENHYWLKKTRSKSKEKFTKERLKQAASTKLDWKKIQPKLQDLCKMILLDVNSAATEQVQALRLQAAEALAEMVEKEEELREFENVDKYDAKTRLEAVPDQSTIKQMAREAQDKLKAVEQAARKSFEILAKYDDDLKVVYDPDAANPGSVSPHDTSLSVLTQLKQRLNKVKEKKTEFEAHLAEQQMRVRAIQKKLQDWKSMLVQLVKKDEALSLSALWRGQTEGRLQQLEELKHFEVKAFKSSGGETLTMTDLARLSTANFLKKAKCVYYTDANKVLHEVKDFLETKLKKVFQDIHKWSVDHEPRNKKNKKNKDVAMQLADAENNMNDAMEDDNRAPFGIQEVESVFYQLRNKLHEVKDLQTRLEKFYDTESASSPLADKVHFELAKLVAEKSKKEKKSHEKFCKEIFAKLLKAETELELSSGRLVSAQTLWQFLSSNNQLKLVIADSSLVETLVKKWQSVFADSLSEEILTSGAFTEDDFTNWITKFHYAVKNPVTSTADAELGELNTKVRDLKFGEICTQVVFPKQELENPMKASEQVKAPEPVRIMVEMSDKDTDDRIVGYATVASATRIFLKPLETRGMRLTDSTAYPDQTELKKGTIVQMVGLPSVHDGLVSVMPLLKEDRIVGKIPVVVPKQMSIVAPFQTVDFKFPEVFKADNNPVPVAAAPAEDVDMDEANPGVEDEDEEQPPAEEEQDAAAEGEDQEMGEGGEEQEQEE